MNRLLLSSVTAAGLLACGSLANANTMTFGTVVGSPGANLSNPYTEDGIIATATSPSSGTHFDIGGSGFPGGSAANSVAVIHRGNGGEQITFTFTGGAFDLRSFDITGWDLDGSSSLTATFLASSGATTSVSAFTTGTIDFSALGAGWTNITNFIFSVPQGVGTCVPGQVSCPEVAFDNVVLQAPGAGETPVPGAAMLFGSVLAGGAGFGAWRRRRKSA